MQQNDGTLADGRRLANKKLFPNFALRGLIAQWKEVHPEYGV